MKSNRNKPEPSHGLTKDVWLNNIFSQFNCVELLKIARTCRFFKACSDELFPTAPWPSLPEPFVLKTQSPLTKETYKPIRILDDKIFIENDYKQLSFIVISEKPYSELSRYYSQYIQTSSTRCIFLLPVNNFLITCYKGMHTTISEYDGNDYKHKRFLYKTEERDNKPICVTAASDGKTIVNVYSIENGTASKATIWQCNENNNYEYKHQISLDEKPPYAVSMSEKDFFLVISNDRKHLSLWKFDQTDTAYKKIQQIAFDSTIHFAYISPNNALIISADKLYILAIDKRTNEYQLKFTLSNQESVFSCITNIDKNLFAVGSNTGNIHIISITENKIKELATLNRGENPIHYLGLTNKKQLVSVTEQKNAAQIAVQSFPFLRLSNENDAQEKIMKRTY